MEQNLLLHKLLNWLQFLESSFTSSCDTNTNNNKWPNKHVFDLDDCIKSWSTHTHTHTHKHKHIHKIASSSACVKIKISLMTRRGKKRKVTFTFLIFFSRISAFCIAIETELLSGKIVLRLARNVTITA